MEAAVSQSILFAIGINHNTADVEVRERIYVSDAEIPALLELLRETLDEVVVVSTCNRFEIYGVTSRTDLSVDYYKDLVIQFKQAGAYLRREDFFAMMSCAATQQLFRVATSLDSKIIGDMQILGQLRDSFRLAENLGSTGKILNQMFQRSFKLGKTVRTQTSLHRGAVSISSAAVELATKRLGSLAEKTVLIVGAGEMARLTGEYLAKKKVGRILITNRTRAKADALLAELLETGSFSGEVVDFSDFRSLLNETDLVISSTSSPTPILNERDFAGQTRPIMLIDIAVPRDIAPECASRPMVELSNIDDLNAIVDGNHRRRMAELPIVHQLLMQEMGEFLIWFYSLPLLPATMRSGHKPDPQTQREIVSVKEFLLNNLSYLHRVAMNKTVEFSAHVEVIRHLVAMKNGGDKRVETSA